MTPQFGAPEPGRAYPDRPAAFGLGLRAGLIAVARIDLPTGPVFDLPGGGIDPGESEVQALVREFGEEVGLEVRSSGLIARADQYFLDPDGHTFNVRGGFHTVEILGEAPHLHVEPDHVLVWVEPLEALRLMRRDAHAWAICAWLRIASQPGRG